MTFPLCILDGVHHLGVGDADLDLDLDLDFFFLFAAECRE